MTLDMHITDKNNKTVVTPKNIRPTQLIGQKPKKKGKWWVWVIISILVIIFGGLGYIVYKGIDLSKKIGLNLNAGSLITEKQPELEKDSTGKYTNFLILGLDAGGGHTDTIMVVSYNYDTHNIVMFSIPRDLYVATSCSYTSNEESMNIIYGGKSYFKINAIYSCYGSDENGFKHLESTIKDVTGVEIQYYAMVNFDGLKDIIDAVGGIDINVPKGFTDQYYPAEKGEGSTYCGDGIGCGYWKSITFKAGVQHMDGKTALEYARSRHGAYTDGSGPVLDYGRAAHQQEVILALKDKVLSTSTLTSPKAIMGLISSVSDNLTISPFTVNDIEATLNLVKTFNTDGRSYSSFVLTPYAANGQIVIGSTKASDHQEPKLGLGKYSDIQEYIQDILTKPAFYSENNTNPLIYVYDSGLGYQETYQKTKDLQNQYPFLNIVFGGTTTYNENGDYIYSDDTESTYPVTIEEFANTLNITNKTKPDFVTTNLYGDVTILLGKQTQTEE